MNDQIDSLFTDESITGSEAEMVREYYEMFLDWDSRAEGKTFYLEHLKPIQDITSLEAEKKQIEEALSSGAISVDEITRLSKRLPLLERGLHEAFFHQGQDAKEAAPMANNPRRTNSHRRTPLRGSLKAEAIRAGYARR